jgi:hypothetical protein
VGNDCKDYRAAGQRAIRHKRQSNARSAYGSRDTSLNAARRLNRCVLLAGSVLVLLFFHLSAQQVPAGTILEARLSVATGSGISHAGNHIEATTIAPVSVSGQILVPQGSTLSGTIASVNPLALGLKRVLSRRLPDLPSEYDSGGPSDATRSRPAYNRSRGWRGLQQTTSTAKRNKSPFAVTAPKAKTVRMSS